MNDDQQPNNLVVLQADYLEALRLGSGRAADQVVQQALDSGADAGDVYLDIFQPTAYEIGRLWQLNRFTVAQEHLATAIIERQMGELHPLFRPRHRRPQVLVIGCVPDEQHRVGARMVADFFEADGWTTYYLGAATPIDSFVAMAREMQADLIGLSVQMIYHLPHITAFAAALGCYGLDGIPIMVGGMPFRQQPDLVHTLNVQFSSTNAREAVQQANQCIAVPTTTMAPDVPLLPVASATLDAFRAARDQIIRLAVTHSLTHPAEVAHFGAQATQILTAGFEFMTRMLETAILLQNTTLLEEQLIWANTRQPYDGVPPEHLLHRFQMYAAAIKDVLPAPYAAEVQPYVAWLIARQRQFVDR